MKFIVDENLPRRLALWLTAGDHDAWHVSDLGLLGRPDSAVWAETVAREAFVVTRDADFLALASGSMAGGVVRLLVGNCSTPVLLARLEKLWPEVELQIGSGQRVVEVG